MEEEVVLKAIYDPLRGQRVSAWLVGGQVIHNIHPEAACEGTWCCLHNPSPHHMIGWKMVWKQDLRLMFRECEHLNLHPDPDDRSTSHHYEHPECPCGCCIDPRTKEIGW